MNCPHCKALESKVIETRLVQQGIITRRRRECEVCHQRFTTYESIMIQIPAIIKRDGRRESFNRDKILSGLTKACEKRSISMTRLDELLNNVEKGLIDLSQKEVSAKIVGNMVMEELHLIDPVSYVRFASFYWNFDDIKTFVNELEKHTPSHLNYKETPYEQ